MEEDFSNKTIIVLVILAVTISVVSGLATTLAVNDAFDSAEAIAPAAVGADQSKSTAKITLTKIDPVDEATALVSLKKIK